MDLDKIVVNKELKIVFMGTPTFSVPVLKGLIENYNVRAIITQPDQAVGRNHEVVPTPIKKIANEHNILVLQPTKVREEYEEIIALQPDLIITCAYGQIIPKELLDAPRLGCINVHASLLPKLRGGAPIHRAIIDGYTKTGITIMYMNPKMDEGDIISQKEIEITNDDTASSLHDKLSLLGRELLLETLPSIINGTNKRTKQNHEEATYAFNIKREHEKINFSKTRKQVYNHIRGLYSWPGSYCYYEGKILKVWAAYTTENYFPDKYDGEITAIYKDGFGVKVGSGGEVVITLVQPEGKTKMNAIDFINGEQSKKSVIGKILD